MERGFRYPPEQPGPEQATSWAPDYTTSPRHDEGNACEQFGQITTS